MFVVPLHLVPEIFGLIKVDLSYPNNQLDAETHSKEY